MARKPTFAAVSETPTRNERFAAKMRHYRERANLTQTDVERMCGVRRDYLSSIELGRIAVVYPETFNRLRRCYGFPGFDVLESMGFDTDATGENIEPSLLALLRAMTPEQQRALATLAKATMKLSE